ncbi:MAG TPA: hypothetical protein VMB50_05285 [Myxococcales bacterium]|nr:hypothetical protein [Myxococcales bacterium]
MRRALLLALLSATACSHLGESVVATMPTVGPRLVVLEPEGTLKPGPRGVLCLQAPEGYAVQPAAAAFFKAGGEIVSIRAALAQGEGQDRLELAVPSLRTVGDDAFLCLSGASPPPPGAVFDRVSLSATAPLLLPEIVWIAEPK